MPDNYETHRADNSQNAEMREKNPVHHPVCDQDIAHHYRHENKKAPKEEGRPLPSGNRGADNHIEEIRGGK